MSATDLPGLAEPDPVVAGEHQLHRALGPFHLIMIGIGCIIGAGIFVIAGTAAAQHESERQDRRSQPGRTTKK